jgi:uncharacterized membrane protein affecting hemolysin expression
MRWNSTFRTPCNWLGFCCNNIGIVLSKVSDMMQSMKIAFLLIVTMGIILTSTNSFVRRSPDEGQTDRTVHVYQNPDEGQTD